MATFVDVITGTNDASGTSIATSTAGNHITGNTLVAIVAGGSTSNPCNGVSDTAGNTYTQRASITSAAVGHKRIFVAENITGNASNTVTASYPAGNEFRRIQVQQHTGLATASFDQQATGSGSGTTATTGTFTTTQATETIVTGAVSLGTTWDADGVGTIRVTSLGGDTGSEDWEVSTIQTGATSSMGLSGSTSWLIAAVTLKQAVVSLPTPITVSNTLLILGT